MKHEIGEVTASDTHSLRRAVLRKAMEATDVAFPEDTLEGAFHLAAFDDGRIVGVASFSPTPTHLRTTTADAWQLRGMAVDDAHQGNGVGGSLLRVAIERLQAAGATALWCNARDSAQGFYARIGFVVEGDGFLTATTGLPHHVMVLEL